VIRLHPLPLTAPPRPPTLKPPPPCAADPRPRVKHSRPSIRGEKHPGAKLSDAAARELLEYRGGALSQREVAEVFDVSKSTVSAIWRGSRWSWLRDETEAP